ncbi:hypothetical protein ACFQQB_36975 [Nonomuraea rubra]|uniref:hypothetical protein n=1 Tax=Nonomuraea rubra TaxID=46180 RepID=UPI00361A72B9
MKWRLTMAGVLGLAAVPMPAQAAAAVDVVAAVQRLQAEGRAAKIFQYTAADWPYDPGTPRCRAATAREATRIRG